MGTLIATGPEVVPAEVDVGGSAFAEHTLDLERPDSRWEIGEEIDDAARPTPGLLVEGVELLRQPSVDPFQQSQVVGR